MKYLARPIIKEALQWTGTRESTQAILDWASGIHVSVFDDSEYLMTIRTLEGNMHVTKGDYVVKGIKGEFYAVKPDIFEKSYMPLTDPVSEQGEGPECCKSELCDTHKRKR